ncbi:A24 family peptidase [Stratiformator vulcanicus]|uniref:Leader peptidase PppA n=1 Tax=Stratiformator vulcanicus TaxID=2527980 RepID=A0A517QZ35_9PLAN|nr:prepilin peptidase [Stratiformator vulcanicus]QDT36916.1 Leader peptidase PppA [Stratiformator vulcanicus]
MTNRQNVIWWTSRGLIGLGAAAALVYFIAIPTWDTIDYVFFEQPQSEVLEDLTIAEQIRIRGMEFFTATWFAALGAVVASYLNVIAYRMPIGKTVFAKDSACPSCGSRIRMADNIPIIGWLRLRGECRDCQEPISVRYPLVEFVGAAIFLTLYIVEVLSGAENIPNTTRYFYRGALWIVWYTKWDVIGLYFYHCLLLSSLLTFALLGIDRHRVPWFAFTTAVVFGLVPPQIWTHLNPIAPIPGDVFAELFPFEPQRLSGVCGLLAGMILGGAIDLSINRLLRRPSWESLCGLGVAGTFLGWQATLAIASALCSVLIIILAARVMWKPTFTIPANGCLCFVTLVFLCSWSWLLKSYGSLWP